MTLDTKLIKSLKPRDLAVIRALREGCTIQLRQVRSYGRWFGTERLVVCGAYCPEAQQITKEAINFLEGAGFVQSFLTEGKDAMNMVLTQDGHRVATMCGYRNLTEE